MSFFNLLASIKNRYESRYDLFARKIIRKWFLNYKWVQQPSILDIGCGQGDDLAIFRDCFPNSRAVGIDIPGIYPTELKVDNIERYSVNLESMPLPFADSSFEVVIANQVFEHLKNWGHALMESARVLKTDGILIIGIPNLASLHNRVLLSMGKQPTCIRAGSMHVRGFTYDGIKEVIEHENIFKITKIAGAGFYPFPPRVAKLLSELFPASSATLYLECNKIGDYKRFKTVEAIDRLAEMSL